MLPIFFKIGWLHDHDSYFLHFHFTKRFKKKINNLGTCIRDIEMKKKVLILCPLFKIKMFDLVLGALDIKNDMINILSNTAVNTSKIFYIEI